MSTGQTESEVQKHLVSSRSGPFGALTDKVLELFHAVFPNRIRVGRNAQTLSVALSEPWRAFEDPAEVLAQRGLSTNEKKRIFDCWAADARALSVADDEGLSGGAPNRLADVMEAKAEMTTANKHEQDVS